MEKRTLRRKRRRSLAFLLALCMVVYGVIAYCPALMARAAVGDTQEQDGVTYTKNEDGFYVHHADSNTTYGNITIPNGFIFEVTENPITVSSLTINGGGSLLIFDIVDAGNTTSEGRLTVTGALTASEGAYMELGGKANIPTVGVGGSALELHTPDGNDQLSGSFGWTRFTYTDQNKWCEVPGGPGEKQFQVDYDNRGNYNTVNIKKDGDVLEVGPNYDFEKNTSITFKLTPPEGYSASEAVIEIEVADDHDPQFINNIEANGNGEFSYTPDRDNPFWVRVWWSACDKLDFEMDRDNQYFVDVVRKGDGSFTLNQYPDSSRTATRVYDETRDGETKRYYQTRYVFNKSAGDVIVTFTPGTDQELVWVWASTGEGDKDYSKNPGSNNQLNLSELLNTSTEKYEYTIVGANAKSDSRIQMEFIAKSGPGQNDPNNPGQNDPNNPGQNDPQKTKEELAKEFLETEFSAYYPGNDSSAEIDNLITFMGRKLYDVGTHDDSKGRPLDGLYANEGEFIGKISITDSTSNAAPTEGLQLPYYNYSIDIPGGDPATGRVYILDAPQKFVIKVADEYIVVNAANATKDTSTDMNGQTITLKTLTVKSSAVPTKENVTIFGNGAWTNDLKAGYKNMVAYKITQEHFDTAIGGTTVIEDIGVDLVIMPASASPVKITGGTGAAAWDVSTMPIFDTSSSANAPTVAEIYYGNDGSAGKEIIFDKGSVISTETSTKNITKVELNTSKISSNVGTITNDTTNNCFKLALNSNYDAIPVIITYGDGTVGYLEIHRVGLNIAKTNAAGGSMSVSHGLGSQVAYSSDQDVSVVATFYYNDPTATPTEHVNLYVTIVTDSGVTHQLVSARLNGGFVSVPQKNATDAKYVDDFVLWSGSSADYSHLVSVSAICYNPGNADSFGGVMVGSGSGVEWIKE